MITHLTGENLPQWIDTARTTGLPGISSFAKGLEQDLDAVTNGLTMNWSSAPVEGRVNHITMVKRQRFGRAGLPLLRKRVLLTAQNSRGTLPRTERQVAAWPGGDSSRIARRPHPA
jgi:transposase